jgi:hypothetical protein
VKNITVSVPDEVYQAARIKAAEQGTSVSAMVRDHLAALSQASQSDRGQRIREMLEKFHRERAGGPHLRMSDNLTREELYDEVVHRHQRSDL